MRHLRALRLVAVVVVAFGGALLPLLFLDGERRALGFRGYGLLLGVLALRAILGFSIESGAPPVDSPFAVPRRRPALGRARRRRRTRTANARTSIDHLVSSATGQASGFHFRLRPVLREVAEQRLQAGYGTGVDAPGAAALLGPVAHDLLRHDRPPPDDRRSAGVDPETLADLLTTLERL